MAKHICAICGAEVGLISEQKLADGNYICRKVCSKKCLKIFDKVEATLDSVKSHIEQVEFGTKVWDQIFVPLKKTKIKVVIHIINGLPNETIDDMLQTIKDVNNLQIDGIKIHMLHVSNNTRLATMYKTHPFHLLTKDEYIDIVVKQLELLNANVFIERLTGDPKKEDLIAPEWVLNKTVVLNDIDKLMVKNDTYQGKKIQL